jgi:hypothetical protein
LGIRPFYIIHVIDACALFTVFIILVTSRMVVVGDSFDAGVRLGVGVEVYSSLCLQFLISH